MYHLPEVVLCKVELFLTEIDVSQAVPGVVVALIVPNRCAVGYHRLQKT